MSTRRLPSSLFAIATLLLALDLLAQGGPGPTPVRYTAAISESIRSTAKVTGTVESRRRSIVASELAGVVTSLDAREGESVRRGAPLVRLRSDNVELRMRSAEGQLNEARARLELASQSLGRARQLFEDEVISRQQLDSAVSESEAWIGRVAQLEADLARLKNDLERTIVRAPFAGVVADERTAVGEWIAVGGEVVELVDTVNLEVTIEVPERYYAGLEVGSPATIRIPSLDGLQIDGKISAIVPRASSQARTFPVMIRFENPGRVGIGMLAEAMLPVGALQRMTLVPKDAIVRQRGTTGVWKVGTDQIIQWIDVETGASAGVWVAVGGVEPGDRIVTRGNERLRPGQTVQPTALEYPKP